MNTKHIFGVMLLTLSAMLGCTGNNKQKDQKDQQVNENQQIKNVYPNNLLIIVDPQIDFTTGSLAVKRGPEAMDRLSKAIDAGLTDKYAHIVVTQDFHPTNHISFVEQGGVFPPHCVQGTEGMNVYPLLQSYLSTIDSTRITYLTKGNIAEKEEFSIFQNDENGAVLSTLISENQYDVIDICGIASDYCVFETAKDLLSIYPAEKVRIATNCIASVSDDQKLLDFMAAQGIKAIEFR